VVHNNLAKKLAFVYNIRHKYPDANAPDTFLETDFDDPETINAIQTHLQNLGYDVIGIEANLEAKEKLKRIKDEIFLAFNYSEMIFGSSPRQVMAEVYEELGIPFTGSSSKVQKTIVDKSKMKRELLKNDLPTLPFLLIAGNSELLNGKFADGIVALPSSKNPHIDNGIELVSMPGVSLNFPLIIKPVSQGSSAGINKKSLVKNNSEFNAQVSFLLKTFHEPVLVEPFLPGLELSVGLLGNPPQVLPLIEPRHDLLPKNMPPMDSLEVKWEIEEKVGSAYLRCPAKVNKVIENKIKNLSLKVWEVLDIKDLCRIDIRMDEEGNPYILDVNSPPGILPPEVSGTGYFPLAARVAGISYDNLLKTIIDSAADRYKICYNITPKQVVGIPTSPF
jgi:D-alanine-D-alanine ligase